MIDIYLVLAYISTIFLFLSTPGPVTVLVINTSVTYGFKAGLTTIAGTNTASLILISVSFIIIQGVFAISERALLWLTLIGSVYLFYFAIMLLKIPLSVPTNTTNMAKKASLHHFKDGFVIGISNPKDILFFIAFFPLFFAISPQTHMSILLLTLIWVALDYGILSFYAGVFATISNNKITHIIGKLSGLTLVLVALYALATTSHALLTGA